MSRDHLHDLGERLGAQQDRRLDQEPFDPALIEVLQDHVTRRGPRTRRRPGMFAALLCATLLGGVAGALTLGWATREEPVGFTVGDAQGAGELRRWHEALAEALVLRFTDGSTVKLDAGARGRVVRTDPHGADVVVESGRARVHVVPRENGSWSVQSGPFLVEVKGTEFDVRWDAVADELALDLFSGHVVLSGCGLPDGYAVSAGHRVRAACRDPRIEVSRMADPRGDEPHAARDSAPQTGASAQPDLAEPSTLASPPSTAALAPASSAVDAGTTLPAAPAWRTLAREGRYREAYQAAQRVGFSEECERADAEDLVLLADAARLAGHGADARAAYLTLRRRFASTPAAARAAFSLGRAAHERGDVASAVRWMDTCLEEHPGGALAPAAAELLLEASLRLGDGPASRAAAARYLRLRPDGPHAADARRLLGDAPTGAGAVD